MIRYLVLPIFGIFAAGAVLAQPSSAPTQSPSPSSSGPSANAGIAKREPVAGDQWAYEIRDEIVGKVTGKRMNTLTEVTPKRIVMRFKVEGEPPGNGEVILDRSWNTIEAGQWRHSPHDGYGYQAPLVVGKNWKFQGDSVNSSRGFIVKRRGEAKVVGQETVTTRAGTFETFKIEMTMTRQPVQDPTRKWDVTAQTWYAPAIDRWVKRTIEERVNKNLISRNTFELVEFSPKP